MRITFSLVAILLFLVACVPLRSVKYLIPDLGDSAKFENVTIQKSATPFYFKHNYPNKAYEKLKLHLDTSLKLTKTNVFLVIKNDSIIYQYLSGDKALTTKQPSFSVAKSFVGTLVGIAIDKGEIKSTSELVIKYLPELAKNDERFNRLTLQHVLDMRSGFDFSERSFNPFSKIVRSYYGANLKKMVGKLKMKHEPGKVFEYQSINTQVLAFILEKAVGKSVQAQMQERLWQPLGAESNALWSMDDEGNIKAFCCLNATALDFAKIGRLYLNGGNWEGKQIVSKKWVEVTTNPDSLTKLRYKNQFWATRDFKFFKDSVSAVSSLGKEGLDYPVERNPDGRYFYAKKVYDYKAQGMFHQSVYVNPQNKVIIVRLGDRQKKVNFHSFVQQVGRSIR
ncbi:serine hydrolase domain-containing protein [Pedobacter chitinilyticus]|uniref:Class C beta-lactamase-related serine hydrolase n=1 Tax=Pedobacter chitinilyticus TaxID=2233776 RepID=A0A3S3QDZ4_9SPHI|nr:serine hydrolase [Pedobacter chitinilyticus]RWU04368.1 class C beta-lactamase-related serine hydrolase [Pedobacter chitinilyticus]